MSCCGPKSSKTGKPAEPKTIASESSCCAPGASKDQAKPAGQAAHQGCATPASATSATPRR